MTITRLLLRATGPARLRAGLRRMTRPVRDYRTRLEPLADVRTTLPRAVIGGDLLDLLSDQLRGMIENEPPLPTSPTDERTRRSAFMPQPSAHARQHSFPPLPLGPEAARGTQVPALERHNGARVWQQLEGNATAQADQFATIEGEGCGRTLPDLARSPSLAGAMSGVVPATTRSAARHTNLIQSALERSLQEYWRLHDSAPPATNPENPAHPARETQRQRAPAFADQPDATRGARAWPEQTGQALMERMASFVTGRVTAPASPATPMNGTQGADEQAAVQNVFHIAVNTTTTGSLHDLGERVAEMLREQAIQHGIDLT